MSEARACKPAWRVLADPVAVLGVLAAIGWSLRAPAERRQAPPIVAPAPAAAAAEETIGPVAEPEPTPPPAPKLDPEAVARAEAAVDEVRRTREQAERRAVELEALAGDAEAERAGAEGAVGALEARLDGPARTLAALRQEGRALLAENERLKGELTSLAQAPRPRRKPLIDKTPVARPAQGEEFHFELRGDRVTFVDLDRLVERVKADAQVQIRLAASNPAGLSRPIVSSVGPLGAFAMRYELGRSLPGSMRDLLDAKGVTFTMLGWEIVPARELRGETWAMLGQPASDFQRVLNSLSPSHATVTLWVYPDAFPLYRRLNDLLHARGFMVAARPLPNGMPIRGSPSGSLSAGQ